MKRIVLTVALLGLTGVLGTAPAGAATISPDYWDFGTGAFGVPTAPKTFVTTGQTLDSFVGKTSLLGYNPDQFEIVSDGCTGVLINGPEDSCSVTVDFKWTDDTTEGDFDAILNTKAYTGVAQYHAVLIGHSAEQGEEGGGGKRGGVSPQAKKKCKKIKNKKKRKKCLKKLTGGTGRTGR